MRSLNVRGNIHVSQNKIQGSLEAKGGTKVIHSDTTENWNAQLDTIAKKDHIYIYTDYDEVDGVKIPGIKVGDGKAYLIDIPFVDGNASIVNNHINDTEVHITEEERLFWNDKVTCFLSQDDEEKVVFSKQMEEIING